MELQLLLPLIDSFVHLSPFWATRRQQLPQAGELRRADALAHMRWLDTELRDRAFVTGDSYTVADITAQCALVVGKATGTPIPDDLVNLTRWFQTVTTRPTARA